MRISQPILFLLGPPIVSALFLVPNHATAQQPASDSASIAAEVTRLTHKYGDAKETNNVAALDSMTAHDAWFVRANGTRHSAAEWLSSFSQKLKFKKYDAEKVAVHVHGDDVAIAVSTVKGSGTNHLGTAFDGAAHITRIWVKRDGQWQVVLQSMSIPGGAK